MYKYNDFTYNLKLKSSRSFYNETKSKHGVYAFEINPYLVNPKHRMGMKECITNELLEKLPIIYVKPDNIPVITKKFTIIVGKNESKLLKYF
jgi:hypothetical protein